ncbi:MAG: response regulator [Myxococcota bacterium]|nr:response regulator [Myxococcota bacterium]
MSDDKKNIMVVEDEESVRDMVAKMLSARGYGVEVAHDGLDGLRKIDQEKPDLLIADVMMPNLDGITLVKALKEHKDTKAIPVIFLTAKGDARSMIEGINVGAKFYVTKPFQMDDLLAKVGKLLGEKTGRLS